MEKEWRLYHCAFKSLENSESIILHGQIPPKAESFQIFLINFRRRYEAIPAEWDTPVDDLKMVQDTKNNIQLKLSFDWKAGGQGLVVESRYKGVWKLKYEQSQNPFIQGGPFDLQLTKLKFFTFDIICNSESITDVKHEWPEDFGDVTHVQVEGDIEIEHFHWKVLGDPCKYKLTMDKDEDEDEE
uniref:Galectin n=1 Tax=Ditylenchus dipsaci TaxID=166011 RepID=A0A915D5F8_9BILA